MMKRKRKKKIEIVYRDCPRCGKQVAGTNRSIHGADIAHKKYAGICGECITEPEEQDMLNQQLFAICGARRDGEAN